MKVIDLISEKEQEYPHVYIADKDRYMNTIKIHSKFRPENISVREYGEFCYIPTNTAVIFMFENEDRMFDFMDNYCKVELK